MLRLLILLALVVYVLHKLGFFKMIARAIQGDDGDKPPGGNVNIDSNPGKEGKKSQFKGGDYVDYEEIK